MALKSDTESWIKDQVKVWFPVNKKQTELNRASGVSFQTEGTVVPTIRCWCTELRRSCSL